MSVVDLGTRLIEGQEVQGKQYTMPPVAPPGMPNQPQFPTAPQPAALVSEVWMSTNLHLPVLTRITGAFGQQTCRCKTTALGEPPASLFQIPAGYKQVGAPPVSLPAPGPLTPPKPPSL